MYLGILLKLNYKSFIIPERGACRPSPPGIVTNIVGNVSKLSTQIDFIFFNYL